MSVTTRATITKTKIIKINDLDCLLVDVKDVFSLNNNLNDIAILNPYGFGSIPIENAQAILQPIANSSKQFVLLGFVTALPKIPHTLTNGETWVNSQKYVLVAQNDAIKAYRQNDNNFNTTLPNGESFVQMMLNRINELQQEIDWMKNHTHSAGSYLAPNGDITGVSGSPVSAPPVPSTLNKDKNYLNDGKALINNQGVNYA